MDEDRTARIALACAVEPGSSGIAEEVAESGVHAVLARHAGRRAPVGDTAARIGLQDVPGMVADMRRRGVRILLPGDLEFPTQLLDLPEPPLALWVRGPLDLRAAALRSVAVVGARACTAYGERATQALVGGLAAEGWAIVSGGAFGIDAAAHRSALDVGGSTVAVLACGIDRAYPRAHDALLARIGDSGALVSELPPGSLPLKHRFLARNRIIAAMTRGTVVVEAARRSGAIATANRALELGRAVMAVPGPITSMASSGTNRLLHEQSARAVADSGEVTALLLPDDDASATPAHADNHDGNPADATAAAAAAGLSPDAVAVLEALPLRGGRPVDQLAASAGMPPAACLAHLGLLELTGLARRTGAGWRRCR